MGFYDFFINWYLHYDRVISSSLRQARYENGLGNTQKNNRKDDSTHVPFLVVIAEDNEIYDELLSLSKEHADIAVVLGARTMSQDSKSSASSYNSTTYKLLVSGRATHLLNLVCGLPQYDTSASALDDWKKWIVVYSDIDTAWLQNPLPFVASKLFEVDIASIIRSSRPQQLRPKYDILAPLDSKSKYCTGFLVIACNPASIIFLSRWEEKLLLNPQLNQPIFNLLLRTRHSDYKSLRHESLSEVEFPSGKLFFDEDRNQTEGRGQTVVVHNNFIIGHDEKKKRFEDYGLWIS
ncbi:hypothetical protein HJC23_000152 [Cyclotella cryptica]|uniref:Nucleotide-diphospho-sugar transferase domain-containing protein n=1 Tax=Cyclotella cryptica TaxID=29204 RepID=A0ABD3PIK3_9STRA